MAGVKKKRKTKKGTSWDTWRAFGYQFKIRKKTPLDKVLEVAKGYLKGGRRERIVGKAERVMVPRCSDGRKWYTVWQWRGQERGLIIEFHLHRAIEWYSKREGGGVKRWEVV